MPTSVRYPSGTLREDGKTHFEYKLFISEHERLEQSLNG